MAVRLLAAVVVVGGALPVAGDVAHAHAPPLLIVTDVTAAADAVHATLKVSLDDEGRADVVDDAISNATAVRPDKTTREPGDDTATLSTLTITAGQTTKTVPVPILDDGTDEDAETSRFTLSYPTNATFSDGSAQVTIADDDEPVVHAVADVTVARGVGGAGMPAGVTLSVRDARVGEGAESASVKVTMSGGSLSTVSVRYATADGTAEAGVDYEATSGTLRIKADKLFGFVSVPILDDGTYEDPESFTLNLSNPRNATISDFSATVTIIDDDPRILHSVQPVRKPAARSPEGGYAVFEVLLGAMSGRDVSVDYATADGTAAAGADYTAMSSTLVILAGQTRGTIRVPITEDAMDERDEMFTVILSGTTTARVSGGSATAMIDDDDDPPSLAVGDATAAEDAGSITFEVALGAASGRDVSVDYATADGTAAAGADYTAMSSTLVIPAGQTRGTIRVPITDDDVDEADEMFTLALRRPRFASLRGSDATATGKIADDDGLPSLAVADVSAAEDAGSVTFEVALGAASGLDVSVDYATVDATAEAGVDYEATSGTLIIPAGETVGTIAVPIVDDVLDEADEAFTLTLSGGVQAVAPVDPVTAIIADDDEPPSLALGDASAAEDAGSVTFEVTLGAVSGQDESVDYTTVDGTAEAGVDYEATSGTLTVPAGETVGTIVVPIVDDVLDEADEAFMLTLSGGVEEVGPVDPVTAIIADDDEPPRLAVGDATAAEDAGSVTFEVALGAVSGQDVSVDYATVDGTAEAGVDYEATSGTLIIPAGETVGTIVVPIAEDAIDEADETFTLTLRSPRNATLSVETTTATITDLPGLVAADSIVMEDARFLIVAVTLGAASSRTVTVSYATSDGSAKAGSDYRKAWGTLTVPAGQTSGRIVLVIRDDALDEFEETFWLMLTDAVNAVAPADPVKISITDDDNPPSLTIIDVVVSEGSPAH